MKINRNIENIRQNYAIHKTYNVYKVIIKGKLNLNIYIVIYLEKLGNLLGN